MQHYSEGKPLAAICAAPLVYGNLGLLEGLKATCYPGFEDFLTGAEPTGELVVRDGQFFLGKGPAAVLQLSYDIVAYFCGEDVADGICKGMLYPEIY
jgi:4-methyl-5(b-hydroxyethyl)-thiazole monophosphate biosynthesis